tara:strand:- start:153 stop:866 length:714 start_codon:yes stop_codon:yes gene_type:complete
MDKKKILKFKKNLTVLILCGGKGLRLRPLTNNLPKPLIKIKEKSILENIIKYFLKYKIKDFIIATGYKNHIIEKFIKKKFKSPNIKTLFTGLNSDIIYRINKASKNSKKYFLICYGDTMIDIDINKYIIFFLKNSKKITVASYRLETGFGIFDIKKNNTIFNFHEKPLLNIWFNVGYFLFSSNHFKFFKKYKKFEKLIQYLARKKLLTTYKHDGKHITINTLAELEKAKKIAVNFIK